MSTTIRTSPVSSGLQAEVRRELHRAHLGRVLARYTRHEATALERDAARVARAAGLPVSEIARQLDLSEPRIYQLLAPNPKDRNV